MRECSGLTNADQNNSILLILLIPSRALDFQQKEKMCEPQEKGSPNGGPLRVDHLQAIHSPQYFFISSF